ncbi:MAG TPA: phosphotransferase family protein [Alphaproteobacteria bacterium]
MTAELADTIAPRPGEDFDASRLIPYLRAHLPETDGPFTLRQFGGGHANLTYLARFGDTEYVVRRPPLGPIAPSAHDMKREHRVLATLPDVFPLAPRSYLYCEDTSIIGAEFHVMERRHGIVIRSDLPEEFKGNPPLARRIGEMVVDTLASLHVANPAAAKLGDLGRPDGYVERQLDGWIKRWHAAKDKDLATVDEAIAWLGKRVPKPQRVSLLHNDFKLDNMIVGADDPSHAVAVLDWDMCTRGDPLMDLGYMLNYWSEARDSPAWRNAAFMPTWHAGFPTRAEAVERYAGRTGLALDDIRWYHVFGVFKLTGVIQQIYIRYLRGQTSDARFAAFGERVRTLAEKACALIGRAEDV